MIIMKVGNAIGIVAFISMFVSFIVSVFTIRPKFDKIFKDTYDSFDLQIPFVRFYTRTMNYMFAILIPNLDKRKLDIEELYGYYNFRSHATRLQVVISYIFNVSAFSELRYSLILFMHRCHVPFVHSFFV